MYKYIDENGEHLHTLDDKPLFGTSTVVGVLAKVLTWWASGLAVEKLGWTNKKSTTADERLLIAGEYKDRITEMTNEDYLALLDKAYSAHATSLKDSAKKGTDMHLELSNYIKSCVDGTPIKYTGNIEQVKSFADWSIERVKRFISSEGNTYSRELWVGGIVDCLFEDTNGKIGIIDFKSAEKAYFNHFVQIGGYDLQISESGILTKDGEEVYKLEKPISYYAVFPFGMKNLKPQIVVNVDRYKEAFKNCLSLYKIKQEFEN